MTLVSAPPLGTAGKMVDGRSMRAQVDQDLAFMDRPSTWRDALGTGVVQQLRHRAAVHGERIALRYLDRGEREIDTATYAELDIAALRVATALRSAGAVGRPVLIALPQGLDFVRCFLGCLYAGAIAIPAPALGDPRGLERIEAIIRHARPALIVGTADGVSRLGRDAKMSSEAFATAVDLLQGSPDSIFDDITPNNIAFLQYTSGSTSSPKGVVITHGNIAADLAMIETAFGQTDASSTVSWLPLHHDMGLIGCVLEPLHLGASAILMSPLAFLQRPARWLRALDVYGATTAGAPNFGYDMCVRAVTDAQIPHLDLSRWKLAFCGSEPVRATSLARFADRFARYGFAASA
ncbi:MAG: AMP-binding protein, partial [Acetobacteraceae bacterium]